MAPAIVSLCISVATAAPVKRDIDLTILDSKTNPCDDFYQYACGGWLAHAKIPADRPMWNRSFSTIDQNNRLILDKILKGYAAGKTEPKNPDSALLGDYYASCMDEKAIEKSALPEFKKQLTAIDQIRDLNELAADLALLHRKGVGAFFNFDQTQDSRDSSQVIGVVDQGGLGLPDRDYYLKDDAQSGGKMSKIRELYRAHIDRMFELAGEPPAAKTILAIETALAKASMSRVDRRDPNNTYHRLERQGLIKRAPAFDWNAYLSTLDPETTSKLQAINIAVPDFFTAFDQLLKTTPLAELKTYLKWHLIAASSEALPRRFQEESFHFVSTALSGQKSIEPRWKKCVKLADSQLRFALSRAFVEVAYGKEGKEKSQSLLSQVESRMKSVIDGLAWMDQKTKQGAELKLSQIGNKVGYPSVWRSYEGLKIDRSSFLRNLQAAAAFNTEYELDKIGKPVNKTDWDMSPAIVNAYYNPQLNEMVFPAGILQYPFFNAESPDYLNYGAIGMVMGHELTHGFDDEGRRYDGQGNMKEWWSPSVLADFDQKTACVVKEYDSFEVLPGLHVNGKLTLGENIADQGGIKLAYLAYSKAKEIQSPEASPEQLKKLFIAYAQSWCQKEQEPFTRMRITVDPHSPARYRVNGVVSQFEPFAQVFQCKPGTPMAGVHHCEVW